MRSVPVTALLGVAALGWLAGVWLVGSAGPTERPGSPVVLVVATVPSVDDQNGGAGGAPKSPGVSQPRPSDSGSGSGSGSAGAAPKAPAQSQPADNGNNGGANNGGAAKPAPPAEAKPASDNTPAAETAPAHPATDKTPGDPGTNTSSAKARPAAARPDPSTPDPSTTPPPALGTQPRPDAPGGGTPGSDAPGTDPNAAGCRGGAPCVKPAPAEHGQAGQAGDCGGDCSRVAGGGLPSWTRPYTDALGGTARSSSDRQGGPGSSCDQGCAPAPVPAVPAPGVPPPGGPSSAGSGGGAGGGAGGAPGQSGIDDGSWFGSFLSSQRALTPQQPDGLTPKYQAPRSGLDPPGASAQPMMIPPRPTSPYELPQDSGGATPASRAFNRWFDQQAYQRGEAIQGPLGFQHQLQQGLADSVIDPAYVGATVAANPRAAAEASADRWGAALRGDFSKLARDYWNNPAQAYAQDVGSLGPLANVLGPAGNPVVAAYAGQTAGGLAHMAANEGKRYGPVLAPNIARAFGVTDPLANVKNDYQRDAYGTAKEDALFLATVGTAGIGGGETGALAGAARGAAGTAARTEAAAEASAEAGALTNRGIGQRAADTARNTAEHPTEPTPTPGSGAQPTPHAGPRILPRPPGDRATPRTPGGPAGTAPLGKIGKDPRGRAEQAPAGAAGTRPGSPGGVSGRRPGGTTDPSPTTAGGDKPLVAAGGASRRTPPAGQAGSLNNMAGPPTRGPGASHPSPGPEDGERLAPNSGTTAHQPPFGANRGDGATGRLIGVRDYLNLPDVRHALTRADADGLTVRAGGVDRPVSQVIRERLTEHPELVRALDTAEDLHSSLLSRPKTFANLLTEPEAVAHYEGAITELNRLGPQRLLERGQASPRRQPVTLTPEQQNVVTALRNDLRDVTDDERTQPGFDRTRKDDEAYKQEYLAESKAKAAEIQPDVNSAAEQLADEVDPDGAFWKGREEPKSDTRAMDKINDPDGNNGDASKLVDLAGARVEFDSVDKVYRALDAARRLPGVKIVRFKDRLTGPQESGYGDLLLNLRMRNGHVAELRLQLASAERVSSYEHALYETTRDLRARAMDQGRDLTLREKAFTQEALRRTNSLYQQAFTEGVR
jgi:Region found in RelA / SpoT proteins